MKRKSFEVHPDPSWEALCAALKRGDVEAVAAAIAGGADIRHRDANGYDALILAAYGGHDLDDLRLHELLELLVDHGVPLSGVSKHGESGLRVLSGRGRFAAVGWLLRAGADAAQLEWTKLIEAVALGSPAEIEAVLRDRPDLEAVDLWSRTAWLVAIQTGDIAKAALLRQHGANPLARGRCGRPPLFYAIENRHPLMLRWLLAGGLDLEQCDEFGSTALMTAVEADTLECAEILLAAGAQVDRVHNTTTALNGARSRAMALRLLAAGADPAHLSHAGHRLLVGLDGESTETPLDAVSPEEFARARGRRFGQANPELMQEPFWTAMIRAGVSGHTGNERLGGPSSFTAGPVWCASRFGQSVTLLPDGRAVQIAGEHEDHYDPDFCIYNDVFVHHPDGSIQIFGYPETLFPPTDFHTATLVDEQIYIIGSLGYAATPSAETPIFRLDTRAFRIEPLHATGESPGRIHGHRAVLTAAREIAISGGKLAPPPGEDGEFTENGRAFLLDLGALRWRRED